MCALPLPPCTLGSVISLCSLEASHNPPFIGDCIRPGNTQSWPLKLRKLDTHLGLSRLGLSEGVQSVGAE